MIATLPASSHRTVDQRRLRVLDESALGDGLQTWRQLDADAPTPHVTASWPWVRAWVDAFGATVKPSVALWEREDSIDGCGLIVRSSHRSVGRVPIQSVHLGTTGEIEPGGVWAEYVTPWVRREHDAAAMMESLIAAASEMGGHRLDIDGVSGELFDSLDVRPHRVERRSSPWMDLLEVSAGDDVTTALLGTLGKSTKKNLKRRLKQYGELTTTWTNEFDEALLDELIMLHQFRWREAGEPGAFASPAFAAFVRSFLQLASGQDRYALVRVADAAGTVGCQLLLREENRVLDFLSGFADPRERPSPGLVCHFTNIAEALRRGLDGYEFLVGDARVKRDLSNATRTLCWAQIERPTRRMKAINAARTAARMVKRVRPSLRAGGAS